MIKTIQIKNIQSHKDSVLELDSGVNVIVGTSDSGKTAILRGLNWLIKNRPLGFAFKSDFAKEEDISVVVVEFSDGNFIIRERNKDINRYLTSEHDEDDPLEAVGRGGPPDEVASLLNLEDYNIQHQHDSYFLLQKSSGEVAREFNDVVGLSIIDSLTKNIKSIVAESRRNIKTADADIETLEKELKEFKKLDEIGKYVDRLEGQIKNRDQIRQERRELIKLVRRIEEVDEDIEQCDILLEMEDKAEALLKVADEINDLTRERSNLQNLIERIEDVDNDIKELDRDLEYCDDIEQLIEGIQDYKKEAIRLKEFENLIQQIENISNEIEYDEKKIGVLEEQVKEIGVCPITGDYCETIGNR